MGAPPSLDGASKLIVTAVSPAELCRASGRVGGPAASAAGNAASATRPRSAVIASALTTLPRMDMRFLPLGSPHDPGRDPSPRPCMEGTRVVPLSPRDDVARSYGTESVSKNHFRHDSSLR